MDLDHNVGLRYKALKPAKAAVPEGSQAQQSDIT